MRRLYLQFWLALILVLVLLMIGIGLLVWAFDRDRDPNEWLGELETFAESVLPPADAPVADLERVVSAFAEPLEMNLSVFDRDGTPLVQIGESIPLPPGEGSRFIDRPGPHGFLLLQLSDGRRLAIDDDRDPRRPIAPLLAALALLAAATAIAALPLARRLTRRLERLQSHVDTFCAGRLDHRAPIEGRDEIADLAHAFNASADRIEALVQDKTRLLANTSHELRTPLTRVRMALELLRDGPREELLDRMDRDIEELDDLIGELLVASRLDAPEARIERGPVDLLALVAEEAAGRADVEVGGTGGAVEGDRRLLRRLTRNLIENALRHGDPPVDVEVAQTSDGVRLTVSDRGPGVPEAERGRIFEPFYRPEGEASAEGGIGLGLALVRQIAERHGGSIRCEGREGGGTRFVLELPAR
ncbi:MAG: HAMP domain-containing histidine kinase [bacterium]|nr:HAMP domain-containing histidine kinase [bacterium]